MTGSLLDPRRNAYRPDIAAAALRDVVQAARYVEGERRQVRAPVLPVRHAPSFDAPLDSEALFGEIVTVYDDRDGWAWAQLERDGYVGYLPSEGLTVPIVTPTHRIAAARTFVFAEADIKTPPLTLLNLNSRVRVVGQQDRFLELASGGYVYAPHAMGLEERAPDFVDVATALLGTPYLWGGRSMGIDCSALVQLALEAAGVPAPRDSDMQAAELGEEIDPRAQRLERGDLVFWKGHVAIMAGEDQVLHANAYHMATALEPFGAAVDRIAASGDAVECVRRLLR